MAVVTVMLVRWFGGYKEAVDAAGVSAWGRKEGFLQLGNVTEEDEVDRIVAAVFGFQSAPRVATTIGIEPRGVDPDGVDHHDEPYVDFDLGDTITAPDENGATSAQRVMSLTVVEDDNGDASFATELKNTFQVQSELFDRQLKKLLNGSMQGASVSAAPNPTGSVTKAENGDSVGSLRLYTNSQLLRRPVTPQLAPYAGIFGTFDPATQQLIEFDFPITMTSGIGGFTAIPLGTFPTGLMSAMVQMGDIPGGGVYSIAVINSSSDNTQIAVLVVDSAGAPYPDTTAITFNMHAVGW